MAKKELAPKTVLERVYNIPLRKEWLKAPKYRRAKKATTALKQFLAKHMKSQDVKIGKYLNEAIWQRGIRNPPHHIKVTVIKDDKGLVKAELVGKSVEEVAKKPEKPEEKKAKKEKVEEKKEVKEEKKPEEKKTEKPPTTKEIAKEKEEPEKVPTAVELAKKKEKKE